MTHEDGLPQTRTQSLFMSLGERERRLESIEGCHGKGEGTNIFFLPRA